MDTHTPMGYMVFTVMAALAQMGLEIKRERITDSVATRRAAGNDLGGRRPTLTDSQIRSALRLIDSREPATQVARDLGISRTTLYRRVRELPTPTAWVRFPLEIVAPTGGSRDEAARTTGT